MIRISEGAKLQSLAAAVITQAVSDLASKRQPFEKRMEAFLWMTGPELELWTDFSSAAYLDPYRYLLPNLREAKKRLQRRISK